MSIHFLPPDQEEEADSMELFGPSTKPDSAPAHSESWGRRVLGRHPLTVHSNYGSLD